MMRMTKKGRPFLKVRHLRPLVWSPTLNLQLSIICYRTPLTCLLPWSSLLSSRLTNNTFVSIITHSQRKLLGAISVPSINTSSNFIFIHPTYLWTSPLVLQPLQISFQRSMLLESVFPKVLPIKPRSRSEEPQSCHNYNYHHHFLYDA